MASSEQIQTALSYFRAGLLDEAKEACEAIVASEPNDAAALRLLGQIAYHEGDFVRAADLLAASLAEKPDQFSTWIKLGNVHADLGRNEDAKAAYERAITLKPEHHLGHFWKGQGFAAEGDMERAFQAYEEALRLNPDFGPAYRLIVKTGNPWAKSKAFREGLELKAASPDIPADEKIHMHFALAYLFQELGKPERVMGHLKIAKGLQKNRAQAWRPALDRLHAAMREVFAAPRAAPAITQGSRPTPLFIVGTPRSGSTLLETMLARHPAIAGGGESSAVPWILKKIQDDFTGQDFPDGLEGVTNEAWSQLAEELADSYVALAGEKAFVIDKLLSNGQVLGLVHVLVPWAKAIYIRRNPSDTALSIFQNHFWEQSSPHLCALDDIGYYLGEYERIMAFWRERMPGVLHEVWYERLVRDPETELKALFAFLGLPYDAACLSFHEGKRVTQTLSQSQVIKPLYQTSIGKADAFAKDLEPFAEAYRAALARP
ncbi:MAG TPA: sulfotransferase, partial [Sphingomonadales bacterium]|nr:sulfotransferase [Sphingomonadales bacterium]